MDRHKLSQYYYLSKELGMWEKEYKELKEMSYCKGQQITGMPFQNTNLTSDKVADVAMKLITTTETINAYRVNLAVLRAEIDNYIITLDDMLLRQIILYRCIELKTWEQVAVSIGGGNTADSCRMYFNRKFPKKKVKAN